MTHEMLTKARANAGQVGAANVEFRLGEISTRRSATTGRTWWSRIA
jgi:hypothetical protein